MTIINMNSEDTPQNNFHETEKRWLNVSVLFKIQTWTIKGNKDNFNKTNKY